MNIRETTPKQPRAFELSLNEDEIKNLRSVLRFYKKQYKAIRVPNGKHVDFCRYYERLITEALDEK